MQNKLIFRINEININSNSTILMEKLNNFVIYFLKTFLDRLSFRISCTGWRVSKSKNLKNQKILRKYFFGCLKIEKHGRVTLLHDFKSSNRFGGSERTTVKIRFGKRRHKNQNCCFEKSFTLDSQWRQNPRTFDDNYTICFAISGKFSLHFFVQISAIFGSSFKIEDRLPNKFFRETKLKKKWSNFNEMNFFFRTKVEL